MTGDLISREALLKEVRENKELFEKERVYLEGLLLNAPTVEERPHGEWIDPENLGANNWCSVCGKFILHYEGICNYCSNCGAEMRGGLKNDGN